MHISYLCEGTSTDGRKRQDKPPLVRGTALRLSSPVLGVIALSLLLHRSQTNMKQTSLSMQMIPDSQVRRKVCLCGRCRELLQIRVSELREQASRLAHASFRAYERSDGLRAAAYARQAFAANAEKRLCERQLAVPCSLRLLDRLTSSFAFAFRIVFSTQCCLLPQKWPTRFIWNRW